MAGVFLFEPIVPPFVMSSRRVRGGILRALQLTEDGVLDAFQSTSENNQSVVVDWESRISYRSGDAIVSVTTNNEIWKFLDEGTEVRYATMEKGYIRRTIPNFVGSQPGKGKKWFVSKKKPHPGIEARNWSVLIKKKFEPIMRQRIDDAIRKASTGP